MKRTLTLDGKKIEIVSRAKTCVGNFVGWNIFINGEKFFVNALLQKEARDIAFSKWVKSQKVTKP